MLVRLWEFDESALATAVCERLLSALDTCMQAETDGHVTMPAWDARPGLEIGRPISARQRGRLANDRVNGSIDSWGSRRQPYWSLREKVEVVRFGGRAD